MILAIGKYLLIVFAQSVTYTVNIIMMLMFINMIIENSYS